MILPASMSLVVLNPNLLCPAKAQSIDLVGVVCVAQPTYITCPSNPTGLHWKPGCQLKVAVNIQNSNKTYGFDIAV